MAPRKEKKKTKRNPDDNSPPLAKKRVKQSKTPAPFSPHSDPPAPQDLDRPVPTFEAEDFGVPPNASPALPHRLDDQPCPYNNVPAPHDLEPPASSFSAPPLPAQPVDPAAPQDVDRPASPLPTPEFGQPANTVPRPPAQDVDAPPAQDIEAPAFDPSPPRPYQEKDFISEVLGIQCDIRSPTTTWNSSPLRYETIVPFVAQGANTENVLSEVGTMPRMVHDDV